MQTIYEKKEETIGMIDAFLSMIEKLKATYENTSLSLHYTNNSSLRYLFDLYKSIAGNTEGLQSLILKILTNSLPAFEAAVKAYLLANIKTSISCGSDPIIPDDMREFYYDSNYTLYRVQYFNTKVQSDWVNSKVIELDNVHFGKGLDFSVTSLDFCDKLDVSPFDSGKKGNLMYFGINEHTTPYDLCRSNDFDAFIWYTMNKAVYYSAYQYYDTKNDTATAKEKSFSLFTNSNYICCYEAEGKKYKDITSDSDQSFNLLSYFYIKNTNDGEILKNVAPGTAYKYHNGSSILLCTETLADESGNTKYARFFPATDDYKGSIWHIDSFCYAGNDLKPQFSQSTENVYAKSTATPAEAIELEKTGANSNSHAREYNKEKGILKLEYYGITNNLSRNYAFTESSVSMGTHAVKNNSKLNFKILPKPFIHYPCVDKRFPENPLDTKKILFNAKGKPDKNGNFSCLVDPTYTANTNYNYCDDSGSTWSPTDINSQIQDPTSPSGSIKTNYDIINTSTASTENPIYELRYRILDYKTFKDYANGIASEADVASNYIGWLYFTKDGSYFLKMNDGHRIQECLYECYTGLTIYQFNYDYVMGMQLFDAKNILSTAFDLTFNLGASYSLNLTTKQYMDRQKIISIIKSMCDADSSVASDCFYSFSNTKYESMLNDAETKRKNGYKFNGSDYGNVNVDFSGVKDILDEYDDNATLNERVDVLSRALTQANVSVTEIGTDQADEVNPTASLEFVENLINNLVAALVYSIITPKIVMLLSVNKALMGDHSDYSSVESFLKAIQNIILGLVQKIYEMVLEEVLAFVMEKLKVIIDLWSSILLQEYTAKYRRLIELMKLDCTGDWMHRRTLNVQIGDVNYADIDNTNTPVDDSCPE